MSEQKLKLKVLKYLKTTYPSAWIYKTADMWTSGIPDILVLYNHKFYAIELKHGKNKPTRLQEFVLQRIKEAGGFAGVCYSMDDVKGLMKG